MRPSSTAVFKSKGPTIRKVMGGGAEFSSRRNFFSLSNSLYEFFFRPLHEYFLGLIGVQEFFSFNFPLREFFFWTSPAPPPPHKFSNSLSLSKLFRAQGRTGNQFQDLMDGKKWEHYFGPLPVLVRHFPSWPQLFKR